MHNFIRSLACAGLSALLLAGAALGQTPTPFPQTLPPNTVVGRLGGAVPGPAEAIPFSTLAAQVFSGNVLDLNLGLTGTHTGTLGIFGQTSGKVTVTSDPAAGTYNFILPNTAGSAGQCLVSQGGSATMTWGACAGGGNVTSVGLAMPGIFTVTGSPVTTSGTLTATASGTSGGVPYFSSATTLASSGALTANRPVIGGGAGVAPAVGTVTGNTTLFATFSGVATNGHCVSIDASGNLTDAGGTCTTGGGGGTVNSGLINQLAWYAAGGTAVSGLTTANNGVLVTSAGGVPSISSTIPAATQANITATGTLTAGATGAGFTVALGTSTVSGALLGVNGGTGVANSGKTVTLGGNLTTSGAFATTLTVSNTTNSTLPAGTHTLAGLDVAQTFTALNGFTNLQLSTGVIYPTADSTTAIQIDKADGTTAVLVADTTNARIGINRTPGAFDLDVNNAANVGGALTFGVGTITGLTINNSPVGSTDYLLYYNATANAIRRCTVTACGAASTAGVGTVNGLSGALTVAPGPGFAVSSVGSTITVGPVASGGTSYFVSTTGNDSNSCLSGNACLTIAHVCSIIGTSSLGGIYTVNIADGTYAGGCDLVYFNTVSIIGNVGTPANVIIQLTGSDVAFKAEDHVIMGVSGMTVQSSGSGSSFISARQFAIVDFNTINLGAMASGTMIIANENSKVNCATPINLNGNATVLASAADNATIAMACTVTIASARAFTQYFSAIQNAQIDGTSGSWSGAGAAASTGQQYVLTTGGKYFNQMSSPVGTGFTDTTPEIRVVKKQSFTATGTYTPSAGIQNAIIECIGSGGAGGSGNAAGADSYTGGGGGSGGYSRAIVTAAQIGASQVVTVSNAGTGSATLNSSTAGGDVSVGTLCVGKGGGAGLTSDVGHQPTSGAGGIAGTGDLTIAGNAGGGGVYDSGNAVLVQMGAGAPGPFGGGSAAVAFSNAGSAGVGFGSGGGGGASATSAGAKAGGNGAKGVVFITEFTNQ